MGWWFSPKNIYGLIMGTSTDLMKNTKRAHWPTAVHEVDANFHIFMGGTGNCGFLQQGSDTLLINCNSGRSSLKLKSEIADEGSITLVGTSVFSDYIGGHREWDFLKTYLPESVSGLHREGRDHIVSEKVVVPWGDEKVHLLPVKGCFSQSDLVVYLERRKFLFLGGLFYNGIHPIMDQSRGLNIHKWQKSVSEILETYDVETLVPHEGDLCGVDGFTGFANYLTTLSNSQVEFSQCRRDYDWAEIPGYTSLEENFEYLRRQ